MNTISAISPIITTFLQNTGLLSLSNPASPASPSTTTTPGDKNAEPDADSTISPQQQPSTPLEEHGDMIQTDAGAESDTTMVATDVETPEDKKRRKRREKDARQRGARHRRSNSGAEGGGGGAAPAPAPGPTPGPGPAGGDGSGGAPAAAGTTATAADAAAAAESEEEEEEEEVVDEDVSLGAPAVPGSGDGAAVEGDDSRTVESQVEPDAPLPGSGDVAEAEGDDSIAESQVEPDDEVCGDQIRIEIVESDGDDGDKKVRVAVTVREVGEGEGDRQNDLEGENTTGEQRPVDIATTNSEPERTDQDVTPLEPLFNNLTSAVEPEGTEHDPTHSETNLVSSASAVEPNRDERPPSYPESQLVESTNNNFEPVERTEHDPIHPEPRLLNPTSIAEPQRDEHLPSHPESQFPNLTPNITKPKRTAEDPRRSAYRIATLHTNKSPPQTTVPTIKQLYPKHGLGPTIEIPSNSDPTFIIDNLESPNTTPTQQKQRALEQQPSLKFPESLVKLREADFADPLRAAYMSATAHSVLADRLWRIVKSANYVFPDQKLAVNTDLPPGLQCMDPRQERLSVQVQGSKLKSAKRPLPLPSHRLVVENAVRWFLDRTRNDPEGYRAVMKEFTWANREMALRLHEALVKKRVVTRKELYGMFVESYGGGNGGVECVVDMEGLGVLFDWKRDG